MTTISTRPPTGSSATGQAGVACRWLGVHRARLAWVAIAIAAVHPAHGLGFPICFSAYFTGVPCPGCGLTRSLSCAIRADFASSIAYHPFGIPILAASFAVAAASLLPAHLRHRMADRLGATPRLLGAAYITFVASFLAYGILRAALHVLG